MVAARLHDRRGFILTEALVALLIFSVVFMALEGSLTLVVRRFADAAREDIAARHAENLRESLFASGCAAASDVDSLNAVVISSTSTTTGYLLRVVQTTAYPRKIGVRSERYDAVSRCR
jgi:Tfp pilus assembly protein PilV